MKYSPRRPGRLVRERLFKAAVSRSSWSEQFYCGKRPNLRCAVPKQKEFLKQDQSGIVAQFFWLREKVREEFFREQLFTTLRHGAVK